MKFSLIIAVILFSAPSFSKSKVLSQENVIYGRDNRFEVQDYDNPLFIEKAKSVAIKVSPRRLSVDRNNPTLYDFPQITLGQYDSTICHNERFIDQVTLGSCTGFLVGKDKLVTAGHCVLSDFDCTNSLWVFDYLEGTDKINKNNVYACKKVIAQKYSYTEKEIIDYAVIQLERKVVDREPLAVRKLGFPIYGTSLVLIGHPMGLPMKIADGASVKLLNAEERVDIFASLKLRQNYFTANLDSYAGNSGSPVFNKHTGKVEGILIQGADDFSQNIPKECMESAHRGNSSKVSEEKVMRINRVPGL